MGGLADKGRPATVSRARASRLQRTSADVTAVDWVGEEHPLVVTGYNFAPSDEAGKLLVRFGGVATVAATFVSPCNRGCNLL